MPVDQRDAAVRAYLDDVFKGHNLKALDKYKQDGNEVLHKKVDRLIAALA